MPLLVTRAGLEPATHRLKICCATIAPPNHIGKGWNRTNKSATDTHGVEPHGQLSHSAILVYFPKLQTDKIYNSIFSVLPLHHPALWSQGKELNPHISRQMRSNRYMQCRLYSYIILLYESAYNSQIIQNFNRIFVRFSQKSTKLAFLPSKIISVLSIFVIKDQFFVVVYVVYDLNIFEITYIITQTIFCAELRSLG